MKEDNWWRHLWWIVAVFVLVIVVFWWVAQRSFDPKFHGGLEPSAYGDSFGFPNAVFSALAFAGVIVTLILQMIELKAQRKEMIEMQRVQLMQSRIQFLTQKPQDALSGEESQELNYLQDFTLRQLEEYLSENDLINGSDAKHKISWQIYELTLEMESGISLAQQGTIEKQVRDRWLTVVRQIAFDAKKLGSVRSIGLNDRRILLGIGDSFGGVLTMYFRKMESTQEIREITDKIRVLAEAIYGEPTAPDVQTCLQDISRKVLQDR